MSGSRFLFSNGILLHTLDAPPVKVFLESHPGTEAHEKTSESIQILSNSAPQFLFKSDYSANLLPSSAIWQPAMQMLVNDSVCKVLPIALRERNDCEELAITTLVSGNLEELNACETMGEEKVSKIFNVHVHVETYVPPAFGIWGNGARLAAVGYGRHVAAAKYSDWVRIRKTLEKLRPPSVTELLLSNDGNQILEGCVTNFLLFAASELAFVEINKTTYLLKTFKFIFYSFCIADPDLDDGKAFCDYGNKYSFEVQTAPVSDGVLPGTIRQLVLEVCKSERIPFREVAPSWSEHEIWEEAFITNASCIGSLYLHFYQLDSLRLLQHVDSIQGGPGMITAVIQIIFHNIAIRKPKCPIYFNQEKIMEKAILEGYPISNICAG
ncbi:Aminotransferase-like, PLP-dependent enzyme [Sesbania bispinosa]|nr:Aminotransferase-like, PLP-dependent enzyme [Sesbania bispinosa]